MEELGRELRHAGLNELALAALFGPAWSTDDVPLVLDRYRSGDPRAALARLFLLGEKVAAAALPVPAERLAEAGLVAIDGDTAVPLVRLAPFAGLLVASDVESGSPDVVTGVNAASRTLATLTVRTPVERALDLGTGSGVEALLAARHAHTVVATDVNERALEFAAMSARLNGATLDLRLGSLFEPVAGERFDLIVANPPFVISPDTDFVFRDSELAGDAICREVVRGAAAHLAAGGFATVLCNWIVRERGQTWEPLVPWVDGLDCDTLLVSHGTIEPLRYAARWNEPLRKRPVEYARAVTRWLDHYDEEGITAIGVGAVIMRGRDRPGWVRGLAAPAAATGSASDHILRLFATTDRLAELDGDDAILDAHLAPVRGHRLDQTLVFDGGYDVAQVSMSLAEGIGLVGSVEPSMVPLLFELGTQRSVRSAAAEAEIDPASVVPGLRGLLELGLLEWAEPGPAR